MSTSLLEEWAVWYGWAYYQGRRRYYETICALIELQKVLLKVR